MKLEVEYRRGRRNQCSMVLYREGCGDGGGVCRAPGGSGAAAPCPRWTWSSRATPRRVVHRRLPGERRNLAQAFTGTGPDTVDDPMGFFSRQARAGIIVANQRGGAPRPVFTATFDRFAVTAA